MSAFQFWALALLVSLLTTAVVLVGRARRRGSGPGPVERVRRLLEPRWGPVDLQTLPRILVDRAVGAARPVPGGRALPVRFRLRCGAATHAAVYPLREELLAEFGRGCLEVAVHQGWPPITPVMVVEFDDELPLTAYRFEVAATPRPGQGRRVTDVVPQPTLLRTHRSDPEWSVVAPGARPRAVPVLGAMTVGAARSCAIVIEDRFVSGVHVTLSVNGEDLVIRDGGPDGTRSTNGVTVNGQPVRRTVVTAELGEAVVGLGVDTGRAGLALWVVHRSAAGTVPYEAAR